ncbi:MAG: UDP-N-acetylglucosamine 1-carboxyvinyltransferase [Clostridia bacterium]
MAERLVIRGGKRLSGTVTVSAAKNAVLPIMAATLLSKEKSKLLDIPYLADVENLCSIFESIGVKTGHEQGDLLIDPSKLATTEAIDERASEMRASCLLMGPLLGRFGRVTLALPGGCAIGARPIDLHIKGLTAMGTSFEKQSGYIIGNCQGRLQGARIYLDFPSVGATENLMMAAALAEGQTIIENAAEEPEIVDLAICLNNMGAKVRGAGTNIIKIDGVDELHGVIHSVIPDRIEAGTYMALAAMTKSDLTVKNVIVDHLKPVVAKLREMGVNIEESEDGVRVIGPEELLPADIKTLPYPGFPTDMQAQIMAVLTLANGTSLVTETVFENRFMHVDEFHRMGAEILVEGHSAMIRGVKELHGASVRATDLRAGAALVIAALAADGVSEIGALYHIDRGYSKLVEKLQKLGADIKRINV